MALKYRTWGGKRANSGRKPAGDRAGVAHVRRPSLNPDHPLHVTLRIARGLPSLRKQSMMNAFRATCVAAREAFGMRLVQYSVQGDHIHLIAEARDRRALSRGVQGLAIRIARGVNRVLGRRRGTVFGDRYHARALATPREVRNALAYVLLNRRHHDVDRRPISLLRASPDAYSSARYFDGWRRGPEMRLLGPPETPPTEVPVVAPSIWLLQTGWRRHGLIDVAEIPGMAGR